MDLDLCFNGALLVDPANQVCSELNLGVKNGKVAVISTETLQAKVCVNAVGKVLTPGFVDVHCHEGDRDPESGAIDMTIFDSLLKMGVTTAVGGNCGGGPEAPLAYREALVATGVPLRFGMLLPQRLLREATKGEGHTPSKYEPVDDLQLSRMTELAEAWLDSGFLGLSWGLRYTPGIDRREFYRISEVAVRKNKPIAAHIRDDAAQVISAAEEFFDMGLALGAQLQFSHIGSMGAYGQMDRLLGLMDAYAAKGLKVFADCYPYSAFSTGLGETTYDEGFLERYGQGYEAIEIGDGPYKGQRLNASLFEQLRREAPHTITIGHFMRTEEVATALAHPRVMVGSDGFLNGSSGHPRAAGTFPRFLRQMAVDEKRLSLYEAVRKMTALPAEAFQLQAGKIGVGDVADLVLLNLDSLKDKADFETPTASPEGIEGVWISGEQAVADGVIVNRTLGKLL